MKKKTYYLLRPELQKSIFFKVEREEKREGGRPREWVKAGENEQETGKSNVEKTKVSKKFLPSLVK